MLYLCIVISTLCKICKTLNVLYHEKDFVYIVCGTATGRCNRYASTNNIIGRCEKRRQVLLR